MDLWQWQCRNRRGKKLLQLICGNAIAEIGGKFCDNCGNAIAKIGGKFCVNCGIAEIYGGIKKKSATSTIFLQHFHNKSQVISFY